MALIVDEQGNISLYQGDSGEIIITDLPIDKNYKVFFSIYNSKGKNIGPELSVYSYKKAEIVFFIPSSLTDLLAVTGDINNTEEYYYGVKICDEQKGTEDTLLLGNNEIGTLNSIIVYPRKVKGL